MATFKMRVMVIRDLETKQEVYGQIIHDEYRSDELDPIPSTDAVIQEYMAEFCSGCYIRNSKLDQPLPNNFEGAAAIVAEQSGMKEYAVVVKILSRPVDIKEVLRYHDKEIEWNAARELHRTNVDPRVLDKLDVNAVKNEIFWNTFKDTFSLVCLAVLITALVGTLLGDKDRT